MRLYDELTAEKQAQLAIPVNNTGWTLRTWPSRRSVNIGRLFSTHTLLTTLGEQQRSFTSTRPSVAADSGQRNFRLSTTTADPITPKSFSRKSIDVNCSQRSENLDWIKLFSFAVLLAKCTSRPRNLSAESFQLRAAQSSPDHSRQSAHPPKARVWLLRITPGIRQKRVGDGSELCFFCVISPCPASNLVLRPMRSLAECSLEVILCHC